MLKCKWGVVQVLLNFRINLSSGKHCSLTGLTLMVYAQRRYNDGKRDATIGVGVQCLLKLLVDVDEEEVIDVELRVNYWFVVLFACTLKLDR